MASENAQLKQQMKLANLSAQNMRVFEQARLDQATSLADQASRLQTMGMNDQASIAYLAQLYGIDQAEMQARLQLELGKMAEPKSPSKLGGLMTVGGTIIGGVAGGPAGATAGGAAGGALGGSM